MKDARDEAHGHMTTACRAFGREFANGHSAACDALTAAIEARDDEWRALQAAEFDATRERCAKEAETAAWGGPMSTMTAREAASKIRALPAAVPGERT